MISALLLTAALASAPAPASPSPLQVKVEAIAATHHGHVALFARNLATGETVAIDPDRPVQTASTIKLAVLYEALEQLRAGKVKLDDPILLRKTDQVPGSGLLQQFDTPKTLTFKDALTFMVIVSDNTGTNLAIDHLGLANINARSAASGLKSTWLYKKVYQPSEAPMPADQKTFGLGKSTAREMASLMQKITRCELSSDPKPGDKALCAVTLTMLRNQFYRDGIPRYIEGVDSGEEGSAIANKTGALDAVRADVGAVSTKDGMLILSIFTFGNADHGWSSDAEGDVTIARLSKALVEGLAPHGLAAKWPE